MNNDSRRTLQTVARALDVLEHMAAVPEPQSLSELSAEFDRSKATMYRVLTTLKEYGFLVQESDGGPYRFGSACARLASQAKRGLSLTEACLPSMRAVWRKTRETVYLSIYQGGQAVAVEAIPSPRPVVATSILGEVLPLHAVSGALVLLASLTDDEIDQVLERGLSRFTPHTVTDPAKLLRKIREIRRRGFAVNREGYRVGVCGISAPVRLSRSGSVIAALSVCMPRPRLDTGMSADVVAAAQQASDALAGYDDGQTTAILKKAAC